MLGLSFENGDDPVGDGAGVGRARARGAGAVSGERDVPAQRKADMFPAYDDDGGLLLVLTPDK